MTEILSPSSILENTLTNITVSGNVKWTNNSIINGVNVSIYFNQTFNGSVLSNSTGDYNYTFAVNKLAGNYPITVNLTYGGWIGNNTQNLEVNGTTITTLNLPLDNYNTTNTSLVFNCSATNSNGLNNMTLYWNYSGTWQVNETKILTGTANSTLFNKTLYQISSGIVCNCLAEGNGTTDFADSNRTFSKLDSTINISMSLNPSIVFENIMTNVSISGRIFTAITNQSIANNLINVWFDGELAKPYNWYNTSFKYRTEVNCICACC